MTMLCRSDRLKLAQSLSKRIPKGTMPGQKFPIGTLVKVDDEMPPGMKHFDSGFMAIIEYTYAQKFWGDDIKSYSLIQLNENGDPINATAWYQECQLTLIDSNTEKGLRTIETWPRIRKELAASPEHISLGKWFE